MDDPPNNDRIEDGIPSEAEAEVDTSEVEAEENDDFVNVDEEDQSDDDNNIPNYDALVREEEKREADEIDDASVLKLIPSGHQLMLKYWLGHPEKRD